MIIATTPFINTLVNAIESSSKYLNECLKFDGRMDHCKGFQNFAKSKILFAFDPLFIILQLMK